MADVQRLQPIVSPVSLTTSSIKRPNVTRNVFVRGGFRTIAWANCKLRTRTRFIELFAELPLLYREQA
jgi:hypothetical protein